MDDLIAAIHLASHNEINQILDAVIERHHVLYPDWDLCAISFQKSQCHEEQCDKMIQFIQSLKAMC